MKIKKSVKKSVKSRKPVSSKVSKQVNRSSNKSKSELFCADLLKEKIKYNIEEYKNGRWKSRQQAIAVAYSQMRRNSKCSSLKR